MLYAIFIFVLLATSQSISQEISKFGFGLKVGANISTLYGEDSDEYANAKFGWNFGGLINYKFSDFIAFQAEVGYSERGCYFEEILSSATKTRTRKYNFNYNYLTVPLLLKLTAGKRIVFEVMGGPVTGFLMSANQKGEIKVEKMGASYPVVVSTERIDENIKDDVTPIDFGFVFGSGIIIQRSQFLKMLIDIRYFMGFNSIEKHNPDIDIHHEVVTINAGFIYYF